MKVWGLWATLGFAILAFVLGQAMGFAVALSMMKNLAQATAESNGTAIAISALVGYPVEIVTLVLATRDDTVAVRCRRVIGLRKGTVVADHLDDTAPEAVRRWVNRSAPLG